MKLLQRIFRDKDELATVAIVSMVTPALEGEEEENDAMEGTNCGTEVKTRVIHHQRPLARRTSLLSPYVPPGP